MSPQVSAFLEWLATASAIAGSLTLFIMALVQGAGKFLSGQAQLVAAIVIGALFGVLGFLGFWGLPGSFYDGLKFLIFLSMTIGAPIGTYQAIKHATKKGIDDWEDDDEDGE